MEEPKIIANYDDYRTELQTELEKTSEGFVRIGYLLKLARDTDILSGSDYKSYLDFAQGEFGLDKSTVSRFIRINDNYSEGGCSETLQEKYKGFGYAKLALMLTLPETIVEEMTPELTKSEIQEIKAEIEEEQAKTDIEHFEENAEAIMNPPEDDLLTQTMKVILESYPRIYLSIWNLFKGPDFTDEEAVKLLRPIDPSIYTVRVAGTGKVLLILKSDSQTLTEARTEEKHSYTIAELVDSMYFIDVDNFEDGKTAWEELYGEKFLEEDNKDTSAKATGGSSAKAESPAKAEALEKAAGVKEKVAPVQPKRVNVPEKKNREKTPKNDPQKSENPKTVSIEYSSQELAISEAENEPSESPENRKRPSEMSENAINTQCGEESATVSSTFEGGENETNAINTQCAELSKADLKAYKEQLKEDADSVKRMVEANNFRAMRTKLESMLSLCKRVIDGLEGKNEE